MSNDYQEQLARIMAYGAAAPAPDRIEQSFEDQQRAVNWQVQAQARRREQERAMMAARAKQIKFLQQQAREMADQQRVADVLRWHDAEEQDRKEFLASGGFPEEYKFDREAWVRSEMARGEQIARRMPAAGAI